jgi:hypothetical protein
LQEAEIGSSDCSFGIHDLRCPRRNERWIDGSGTDLDARGPHQQQLAASSWGCVHLRIASRSRPDRHGRRLFRRPSGLRNCQPAKLSGGAEKALSLYRARLLLRAVLEIQSRFEMIAHWTVLMFVTREAQ